MLRPRPDASSNFFESGFPLTVPGSKKLSLTTNWLLLSHAKSVTMINKANTRGLYIFMNFCKESVFGEIQKRLFDIRAGARIQTVRKYPDKTTDRSLAQTKPLNLTNITTG
jgi:hypothetical protein